MKNPIAGHSYSNQIILTCCIVLLKVPANGLYLFTVEGDFCFVVRQTKR